MKADLLKYALQHMHKKKLRSFLTILSVLIGIAAMTTLIAFGQGVSTYVADIAQQMGEDKLMVQPRGFGFGPALESNVRLREGDVDAVESVAAVAEASGTYVLSGEVLFDDQRRYVNVFGLDYGNRKKLLDEVFDLSLIAGRDLRGKEKSKAVFGFNYQVPDKIFKKPLKVGDNVLLNNHSVEVAGFYDSLGNPEDDKNIYMTDIALEEVLGAQDFQFIVVRTVEGRSPTAVVSQVRRALLDHRNQVAGREDFFVQTFEQVIATFTSILDIVTTVVILIALISLVVASVNIANTMYTAVLERTREIGVFKAVGARNHDILFVFVMESGMLSLLGGIIGIVLGWLIAFGAGRIVAGAGFGAFSPLFTWQLALGALLFSFLIGALAGLLPAWQASRLKPVDALRYE